MLGSLSCPVLLSEAICGHKHQWSKHYNIPLLLVMGDCNTQKPHKTGAYMKSF